MFGHLNVNLVSPYSPGFRPGGIPTLLENFVSSGRRSGSLLRLLSSGRTKGTCLGRRYLTLLSNKRKKRNRPLSFSVKLCFYHLKESRDKALENLENRDVVVDVEDRPLDSGETYCLDDSNSRGVIFVSD